MPSTRQRHWRAIGISFRQRPRISTHTSRRARAAAATTMAANGGERCRGRRMQYLLGAAQGWLDHTENAKGPLFAAAAVVRLTLGHQVEVVRILDEVLLDTKRPWRARTRWPPGTPRRPLPLPHLARFIPKEPQALEGLGSGISSGSVGHASPQLHSNGCTVQFAQRSIPNYKFVCTALTIFARFCVDVVCRARDKITIFARFLGIGWGSRWKTL